MSFINEQNPYFKFFNTLNRHNYFHDFFTIISKTVIQNDFVSSLTVVCEKMWVLSGTVKYLLMIVCDDIYIQYLSYIFNQFNINIGPIIKSWFLTKVLSIFLLRFLFCLVIEYISEDLNLNIIIFKFLFMSNTKKFFLKGTMLKVLSEKSYTFIHVCITYIQSNENTLSILITFNITCSFEYKKCIFLYLKDSFFTQVN